MCVLDETHKLVVQVLLWKFKKEAHTRENTHMSHIIPTESEKMCLKETQCIGVFLYLTKTSDLRCDTRKSLPGYRRREMQIAGHTSAAPTPLTCVIFVSKKNVKWDLTEMQ